MNYHSCLNVLSIDCLAGILRFVPAWFIFKMVATGDSALQTSLNHGGVTVLDFRVPMASSEFDGAAIDISRRMSAPTFFHPFRHVEEIIKWILGVQMD